MPVLPVRDTVLFPHAVLPLTVGRESSIQLIQSLGEEKTILVVAQRDARLDSPEGTDLHSVGTRATVHKVVKMPNQSLFVFTEGNERVQRGRVHQLHPFMTAEYEAIEEVEPAKSPELEAMQRNVVSQFQTIVTSSPTLSDDLQTIAINIDEPGRLADFIASSLPFLTTADKQDLLETADVAVPPGAGEQTPGEGAGSTAAEDEDPDRGAGFGAAIAAGLLPARAVEGDPERTWGPGRYAEGYRRAEGEDRARGDAGGGAEGRAEGAGAAEPDESGGGGLLADAELCGVAGGASVGEDELGRS